LPPVTSTGIDQTSNAIPVQGFSIVRSFENNRVLPSLFGEHDGHLALIERELSIDITPRGNRLTIRGSRDACVRAEKVFDELQDRLSNNLEISKADVKGAIRMSLDPVHHHQPAEKVQIKTRHKVITPRSPGQRRYISAIANSELVFGSGPAGTGKSYLAVACAAEALLEGRVERIIFSRPAVEAGENLGFLPGDMKEKVDPYLRPLYDALYDVMPAAKVERDIAEGIIEIAPLAFMRGRTLAHSFIILDEAQNTTPQQMKMFLTRLGEGSHMVVNGDPSQVDLPSNVKSGLAHATGLLKNVKGISLIELTAEDIVRHPLVSAIVGAYDREYERKTDRP
jgi:phosphate starvation-inducible PhoH-like protein